MREEFNLDALVVRGLEPQDPEARVVNPLWRAIDRNVSRFRQRLGTLRNRIADLSRGTPTREAEEAIRRLQAGTDALDAEREALKQKRSATSPSPNSTSTRPWMRFPKARSSSSMSSA